MFERNVQVLKPNQIFHQGVNENPFNFAGKVCARYWRAGRGIGRCDKAPAVCRGTEQELSSATLIRLG